MTTATSKKLVRGMIALVVMTAMFAGEAPVSFARDGNRIKFKIVLTRTAAETRAKGKAKYEERSDRRKVNIEVEKIATATNVEFFVDGVSLGTLPVVLGTAELELSTNDGDNPPTMTPQSAVDVYNADTDELLLTAN